MRRLLFAVPLLAVPLLLAVRQAKPPDDAKPPVKAEQPEADTPAVKQERPAIDADATAKTETATFALG
jgi:hypothetical protein